jgi:hypothetical protein
MRNNELYELAVYYDKGKKFTFRDSLKLLPASLDKLAASLCPERGRKFEMDHSQVGLHNLKDRKNELMG